MSWLEFIAAMSSALGWPIVALVAVFFLRSEIKTAAQKIIDRIGEIAHVKAPGVAIDFKQEVKELAETTEDLKDETPKALPAGQPQDFMLPPETAEERVSKYQELAAVDPRAAILLPFADLDALIRQEFRRQYPDETPTLGFSKIVAILERDGVLEPDMAASLREMVTIRNRVAHERTELDVDVANYFVQSVGNVLTYLVGTNFFKDEPNQSGRQHY